MYGISHQIIEYIMKLHLKLRRLISIIAILAISSYSLFAMQQKVFTTRDDIYLRVSALCQQAGVLGPSSFSPMPARALAIAMERIDYSNLDSAQKEEYDELQSAIFSDDEMLFVDDYFMLNAGAEVNLGINVADYKDFRYGHEGEATPGFDRREDTLIPYRYEKALLSVSLGMSFGNHIWLEGLFDVKNPNQMMYESTLGMLFTWQDTSIYGIAAELPYRAGASVGNDYINFIIGRFPHSTGSGITGNMLIGDNFVYQEISNLSLMSNHFTYNISVTRFDQQTEIETGPNLTKMSQSEFDGMQQFRVMHRFDVTLFDSFRLALNLATIYNSTYGFDIRFFYPFVLSHNYYNYEGGLDKTDHDEANNIMSLEFEWTVAPNWLWTGQLVIDQFQLPWEDSTSLPAAWGALTNVRYSKSLPSGRLDSWFEAVYTNPYLYLNGKRVSPTEGNEFIDYNLDYMVGYFMSYMSDPNYSGYIYGPDNIVLSIGSTYTDAENRFEIGGNILYRIKGQKGIKILVRHSHETIIDMSDAYIDSDFGSNKWAPSGGLKKAEHLIKLSCQGKYNFDYGNWGILSIYAALGGNIFMNYQHNVGKTEFQPQMLIGVCWNV